MPNLSETFAVLAPSLALTPVPVTPTIYQELDQRFEGFKGGKRVARLAKPGDYVVVPRGTWHTAHVSVPTRMLFVTPGEGTENKAL